MTSIDKCVTEEGLGIHAKHHPPFRQLLVHFSKILRAQRDICANINIAFDATRFFNETASLAGEPLNMRLAPELFLSAFRQAAHDIWPVISEELPLLQPDLQKLFERLNDDDWCLSCLAVAVRGDAAALQNAADMAGVEQDILLVAIRMAYAPCIASLRPILAEQPSVVLWRKCFCPICGSDPDIGTLELHPDENDYVVSQSGQSWLHCPQCGQHWRFTRVVCPSCGNQENDKLTRFSLPEIPYEYIYACDACHHYLPCLDLTAVPESDRKPDLLFASLKLVYLDAIAQERGYRPLSPVPWNSFDFA
jgi:FdhE protein